MTEDGKTLFIIKAKRMNNAVIFLKTCSPLLEESIPHQM